MNVVLLFDMTATFDGLYRFSHFPISIFSDLEQVRPERDSVCSKVCIV